MTRKEFYEQSKATVDKVFSDYRKWSESPLSNDIPSLDVFLSEEYHRKFGHGDIIAFTNPVSKCSQVAKIKRIGYRIGDSEECYVMVDLSGSYFPQSVSYFVPVVEVDARPDCNRIGVAVEFLK